MILYFNRLDTTYIKLNTEDKTLLFISSGSFNKRINYFEDTGYYNIICGLTSSWAECDEIEFNNVKNNTLNFLTGSI